MSEQLRAYYMPSPREIARACAAIRANWTQRERQQRYVGRDAPQAATSCEEHPCAWFPPVIETASLRSNSTKPLQDLVS